MEGSTDNGAEPETKGYSVLGGAPIRDDHPRKDGIIVSDDRPQAGVTSPPIGLNEYYSIVPRKMKRNMLQALAKQSREETPGGHVRVPLNRDTPSIYRAIRNSGLLNESPIRVSIYCPDVNIAHTIFEQFSDRMLRVLVEPGMMPKVTTPTRNVEHSVGTPQSGAPIPPQGDTITILGYNFWNRKFKAEFGVEMRKGEEHLHDYLTLMRKLPKYGDEETRSRDGALLNCMAGYGYLEYIQKFHPTVDEHNKKFYRMLYSWSFAHDDLPLYEQLELLSMDPKFRLEIKHSYLDSAVRMLPIELLKQYIGDDHYEVGGVLDIAADLGDGSKVDYLYQRCQTTNQLNQSVIEEFIVGLIGSGNIPLLTKYWALHPLVVDGYFLEDAVDTLLAKVARRERPVELLQAVIDLIHPVDPRIADEVLSQLIHNDDHEEPEFVRRLIGRSLRPDLDDLLLAAIRHQRPTYIQIIMEGVNGIEKDGVVRFRRTPITERHIRAALENEDYQLIHALSGLILEARANPQ